jgi:pSer/pThr/pTyr-binding forkhead associated (FHA) protein
MDTRITVTAPGTLHPGVEAPEDILGLEVLASGERLVFPAEKWIVIGAAPEAHFVVDDPLVSRRHCMVERRGLRRITVHDCGSKNGTWIDDSSVSVADLPFGAVLTVGGTAMVPFTRTGPAGLSLGDFIGRSVRAHGSIRRAARALRVPRSTLSHWLRTGSRS